jgi:DNA helicase MCM8
MPARTAVIAAANPIGGTYCRAKSLKDNVKMSSALFSRFDLVFAMLDEADEEGDFKLSEHVMSVHCAGNAPSCFHHRLLGLSESQRLWLACPQVTVLFHDNRWQEGFSE